MIQIFLLLPLLSFAAVVQYDVSYTDKQQYSFKDVCSRMVSFETPLIEAVSGSLLDCMGKKIDVGSFCEKELAHDPYLLGGRVEADQQKVICHSGKKVTFKYQCVKFSDRKFCHKQASVSCGEIKQKLAKRLDLVQASFTRSDKGIQELNCYFESLPLAEKSHGRL